MMVPGSERWTRLNKHVSVEGQYAAERMLTVYRQFEVSERAPHNAYDSLHATNFLAQKDVHWLEQTHLLELGFDLPTQHRTELICD